MGVRMAGYHRCMGVVWHWISVDVLGCQCGSAHIRHVWVRRMAGHL